MAKTAKPGITWIDIDQSQYQKFYKTVIANFFPFHPIVNTAYELQRSYPPNVTDDMCHILLQLDAKQFRQIPPQLAMLQTCALEQLEPGSGAKAMREGLSGIFKIPQKMKKRQNEKEVVD